jgi:hypothetical protein
MRLMQGLSAFALAILALCASLPATADEGTQWTLMQRVGEVWITTEQFEPVALKPNDLIPSKSVVVTGARGRAILARGGEQIILHPNTRLVIPEPKENTTRLGQTRGTALFRVERKTAPHFQVDTPFMAAVVKGTVFTVTVTGTGSSVQVEEGAVSVGCAKGEAVTLVRPGMKAEVKAYNPVVIDLTDSSGKRRKVTRNEQDDTPAPTERFDWGPGDSDDGTGPQGPQGTQKEARLNNLVLRDTIQPAHGRATTLLRTAQDDRSMVDLAIDAAHAHDVKLREDRRVARIENLGHLADNVQLPSAESAIKKVELASGKHFLKSNEVKVEKGFSSSLVQQLIVGVAAVMILFNLGQMLFRKKKG